jgi:hypothetical protein
MTKEFIVALETARQKVRIFVFQHIFSSYNKTRFFLPASRGMLTTLVLVLLSHLFKLSEPHISASHPYTQYIISCITAEFVGAYVVAAIFWSYRHNNLWAMAIGLLLPLMLATLIEILQDATSHNLLGLEIAFAWVPLFGLAVMGGFAGRWLRSSWQRMAERRHKTTLKSSDSPAEKVS